MNDELYHYGVPGMKWGVRRDRERRARVAYILDKENKIGEKKIQKLSEKRKKQIINGRDTSKTDRYIERYKKNNRLRTSIRNIAIKDLSEKDIKAGKRVCEEIGILSALVGGYPGVVVANAAMVKDAHNYMKKYV